MERSIAEQGHEAAPARGYRALVIGLFVLTLLMVVLGVWGAATTAGVVRPWMDIGLLLAFALATVTGVSKTSSA
jgi:hypothetical protein